MVCVDNADTGHLGSEGNRLYGVRIGPAVDDTSATLFGGHAIELVEILLGTPRREMVDVQRCARRCDGDPVKCVDPDLDHAGSEVDTYNDIVEHAHKAGLRR